MVALVLFLVATIGCTVVEEQPVNPQAMRAKPATPDPTPRGKIKAKAPPAPTHVELVGTTVSVFESEFPPSAKAKTKAKAIKRFCKWARVDQRGQSQRLATFSRPCPTDVHVAWNPTDSSHALVNLEGNLWEVRDGTTRKLPSGPGTLRDWGIDDVGRPLVLTLQVKPEISEKDGIFTLTHDNKSYDLKKREGTPVLAHVIAFESYRWTHLEGHAIYLDEVDALEIEPFKRLGLRTQDRHPGVHGLEGKSPEEETAKKLSAVEANLQDGGRWMVAETDYGQVVWWQTEEGPNMPVWVDRAIGLDPLPDHIFRAREPLTIEHRGKFLLLTQKGAHPRVWDLKEDKMAFTSNTASGVLFWPFDKEAEPQLEH
ncbi:MAG: hypothetical protein HN348_30170 [Proteobacteria bacterium]|nr:hypothetical protein [Pseudomonadota bacterium]